MAHPEHEKKMAEKISENIWKINADSNIYFLDFEKKIIIDVGPRSYRDQIKKELMELVDLDDVEIVILTHFHYDHIGNFDLFKNAKFYASREEIEDLKNNGEGSVLDKEVFEEFTIELNELKDMCGLKVIKTPGHTRGSVCLFYEKEGVLFTGDTVFHRGGFGRVDLPTSIPDLMRDSVAKIGKIKYKKLCPGHDY